MKKKNISLLCALLTFGVAFAQTPVDSLKALLKDANDTYKADLLNNIADQFVFTSPDSVKDYADKATTLSKKIKYPRGLAASYFWEAYYFQVKKDWQKSIDLLEQSAALYEEIGDYSKKAFCLYIISTTLLKEGKSQKALEILLISLKELEKKPDNRVLGYSYNFMAVLLKEQGNYQSAIDYYNKAFYYLIREKNLNAYAPLENIGILYSELKKNDSALYYLTKAYKGDKVLKNVTSVISVLTSLSTVYLKENKVDSAEYYLNEAIDLNEDGSGENAVLIQLAFGEVCIKKKQFQKAIASLNLAENLLPKSENINRKKILNNKAIAYQGLGDYKNAFIYQARFTHLQDSLNNITTKNRISELQANYEFERKELDILKLQQEARSKSLTIKIIFISIGFVLSAFLFYIRYRKQAQEQKEKELQREIQEAEIKALRSQINPHFIFNCLNSINNFVLKQNGATASRYLTMFAKLMRLILENSRSKYIFFEKEIDMLKLYIDLEQFRANNSFEYVIHTDDSILDSSAQIPSMIVQPFVENAIHHGLFHKESKGLLSLSFYNKENYIECVIEDNGVGRDATKAIKKADDAEKTSFGIQLSKERLTYLYAELNIAQKEPVEIIDLHDNDGSAIGTRCILRLPFKGALS